MRTLLVGLGASLLSISAASAASDWDRSVKVQAQYNQSGQPAVNATVDVVYDKPGRTSKAWGTLSYMRPGSGLTPSSRIYAHGLCVGYFNSGDNVTVAGTIVSAMGAPATGAFLVFEFDILNQKMRAITKTTEADARTSCKAQSGIWPGVFNHGFIVVK